jgi:hypothetical protein
VSSSNLPDPTTASSKVFIVVMVYPPDEGEQLNASTFASADLAVFEVLALQAAGSNGHISVRFYGTFSGDDDTGLPPHGA